MGKKRQHRPEKHKQDLEAQMLDPNAAGVRVSTSPMQLCGRQGAFKQSCRVPFLPHTPADT